MSIVWIQMPGFNDNEKTAHRIAQTIDDRRVRHFYDPFPNHLVGKAFADGLLETNAGPAWDIYFFYDQGTEWRDRPPKPTEWIHQLGGSGRADPTRFHSGNDLVEHLHEAMHKVTGQECTEP